MAKVEMIIEPTRSGYSAYAPAYAIATTGRDLEELRRNILEALALYFEDEGRTVSERDLRLTIGLPSFFEFYRVINLSALATRIGMNPSLLAQYAAGHKRPGPRQVDRILRGLRDLGHELSSLRLQ